MTGAAGHTLCRQQRSLLKKTLSPTKPSTSSSSKKKSNDQSNLSSHYNNAKLAGSIKPAAQLNKISKPAADIAGGSTKSVIQPIEESVKLIPSIKPVLLELQTNHSPLPICLHYFVSKSPLGTKADEKPKNVS